MNFTPFRDWFFDRLLWSLISGEWVIKIKDFENSGSKSEQEMLGLMVYNKDQEGGVIYLDNRRGTPRILVHELGHVVLGDILDTEARDKNGTQKKVEKWTEDQVLIFERLFYACLSTKQNKILKTLIDRAKIDFKQNL